MSNYSRFTRLVAFLLFVTIAISGCSIRKMVSGTIANLTDSLYRQRDIQLAREGSASFLLAIDGMIHGNPDDPNLLLMGTQTYSAYASAFALCTEPDRAYILYDQALEYGFRMWEKRFHWTNIRQLEIDTWIQKLDLCSKNDLPYLYWTASAWSGWITVNPESTLAIADLSLVVETMKRINEIDTTFQDGAVHLFFGMYYAVQPRGLGQDLDKSFEHFTKSMELAGPNAMLPKVLFARYYTRALLDEELFVSILNKVLDSPSRCPEPELNLMNAIARERAATYLKQLDDLF
ncbi:TRAP transporter TatT component family protein [bacterium]|nr:TRAP transporter TatT component family protein [bacterium]